MKRGVITFSIPVIVTYSYLLSGVKMFNTVIIRIQAIGRYYPVTGSKNDEEIKNKIREMTGHDPISLIEKVQV